MLLAALPTAACGYAVGSGLHERGVRTVHLRAIANDTFRQRLEAELGAAVARELAVSSDLLPATAAGADAILELRIETEHERTLVTGDRAAPVREGSQSARVRMVLIERRSGRTLIDRDIADRAEFRDPIGEDLTSARRELVDDLARKIVLALETGF
ncbi:MAG: LPS assembly lipoprotein LptE [Planctomycetota bacterium]